ncbi:protein AKNAD1 isoform X9 [Papio anubis]|uniref:protein AKNAD1 isoform X9 n=1 Tax=Papio anubis TaxID=9555 RepID=UPI0012AE4A4C|nr:protein AKNAD1 isoform X9 [Papio anubis]
MGRCSSSSSYLKQAHYNAKAHSEDSQGEPELLLQLTAASSGDRGRERSGCTHMDEADFSEDTTYKQEDLPYDGDLSPIKICNDYSFTSKNDAFEVSSQIIFIADDPQEKAMHNETCGNTAMTMPLGKTTENAANKKDEKEKQCTAALHIPANEGDASKSSISDILLHHLSKEPFLRGQGIDCETLPEISNADSFEEEAIIKSIISCCNKNSWPKEQTPELTDQLNPKRDGENSNKPGSPTMTGENTSDLEETVAAGDSSHQENVNILTKTKDPGDKQNSYQGQAPQKQHTEKASSGNRFKYGQGQVHYQLPDFSKIAPEVKNPKNNIINKPLAIAKQASFSSKLREKPAVVQDILETTPESNRVEKQHQEQKGEITEPSQQIQMEPTVHIHQELLTGIESEASLSKLSPTSQKGTSSSSSYIFQKISQGKRMCQKLKEQTDQLKTKVQEFSKRIKQESPYHLQDKKLVLEKLQGHLELLEQNFLATKDKHLTLQQQVHKHESTIVGDFDPERKVEGEIFKLEMLLEDVKDKMDESKYTSAPSLPVSSPVTLDDLASTSSSLSNEVPEEHPGHPPGPRGSGGSEATGTPQGGPQEAPKEELCELTPQMRTPGALQEGRIVQRRWHPVRAVPSVAGSLNGSQKWRKRASEGSTVEDFQLSMKRHHIQIRHPILIQDTASVLILALKCRVTNVRTVALRFLPPEEPAERNHLKNFITDTTLQDRITQIIAKEVPLSSPILYMKAKTLHPLF